jgi:hypothetical protein
MHTRIVFVISKSASRAKQPRVDARVVPSKEVYTRYPIHAHICTICSTSPYTHPRVNIYIHTLYSTWTRRPVIAGQRFQYQYQYTAHKETDMYVCKHIKHTHMYACKHTYLNAQQTKFPGMYKNARIYTHTKKDVHALRRTYTHTHTTPTPTPTPAPVPHRFLERTCLYVCMDGCMSACIYVSISFHMHKARAVHAVPSACIYAISLHLS